MSTKTIRIMIVTDGDLNFDDEGSKDSDLSLKPMIDELKKSVVVDNDVSYDFSVDWFKQEYIDRNEYPNGIADISKKFDQLWLFGRRKGTSSVLTQDEVAALAERMGEGLGVFATGDHDSIGMPLCGGIPRVRFLRRWRKHPRAEFSTPRTDGFWRADTLAPKLIPGGDETGEYDATPKVIWSSNAMMSNGEPSAEDPHPLCFHPSFPRLAFLPDHLHEGVCRVPEIGSDPELMELMKEEFPEDSDTRIVAWTTKTVHLSAPKIHPVISCFDHPTQGRVVADSTFHHWLWGNIKYVYLSPTAAWDHIRQYPVNIAAWLARITQISNRAVQVVAQLQMKSRVFDARIAYRMDKTEAKLKELGIAIKETLQAMHVDLDILADVQKLALSESGANLAGAEAVVTPGKAQDVATIGSAFEAVASRRRILSQLIDRQ
jgi:hypothetical protein